MESPKLTYEKTKRLDKIEDIAYERLFENYLKFELKGEKKLIDIDSTDQETVVNKAYSSVPQQGMVYTFIHVNKTALAELQNMSTGKTVKFHDFIPIVFCTNFDFTTNLLKGINLNLLPKEERVKFFQAFYEYYQDFFERIEEKTEYNQLAVNEKYKISAITGKNPALFQHFNNSQKALFNFAYRSYNLQNVAKFRMIEYQEWQYIPFFDAKHSFKKIGLDKLYALYQDTKSKIK